MGCGSSNEVESSPEISPYELEILKNDTKFTEDEIKMWYGAFMDETTEGQMDKKGFISLYSRLYPKGTVNDFCDRLFMVYDKDGSGTIDFKEFMMTMNVAQKGTSSQKLEWAFSLYDSDNSGIISRQEVVDIVSAIYKMQAVPLDGGPNNLSVDESVEEIFKALEKDNDGQLDSKEFILGATSNGQVRKALESI